MKSIVRAASTAILLSIGILIGFSNVASAEDANMCWQATYARDLGYPATNCASNQDKQGEAPFFTCYNKCPRGYASTPLGGCMQSCPANTSRDAFGNCVYTGRTQRYEIKFYTLGNKWSGAQCGLDANCHMRVCNQQNKYGCKMRGPSVMTKCAPGYKEAALHCIPDLDCRGYKGKGVDISGKTFCETKRLPPRPPQVASCPSGYENQIGRCYKKCKTGFNGVLNNCWADCRYVKGYPEPCGMGCAKDARSCQEAITDQVISTLEMVANIASMIGTGGGASAIKSGAKSVAKHGLKTAIKNSVSKTYKSVARNITRKGVKGVLKKEAQKMVTSKSDKIWKLGTLKNGLQGQKYGRITDPKKIASVIEKGLDAGEMFANGLVDPTVFADLDPTGIANVVLAYNKPLCEVVLKKTPAQGAKAGVAGSAGNIKQQQMAAIATSNAGRRGKWQRLQGAAMDIGAGPAGSLWAVGTNKTVYSMVRGRWQPMNGAGTRIDAGPNGTAWVVGGNGVPYQYVNRAWKRMPSKITDIGVGANGDVWAIGADRVGNDYGIYHLTGNRWTKVDGGAVRIDVDPKGVPWVVNSSNMIYRRSGARWLLVSGRAKDIGIGADGTVWIVGVDDTPYRWSGSAWIKGIGGLANISVDDKGNPVGTNAGNQVWAWK